MCASAQYSMVKGKYGELTKAAIGDMSQTISDLKKRADQKVLSGAIAYPFAGVCVIFAFCVGRILRHSRCGGFTCSCHHCEVSAAAFA